jgi:hypothetical protein
MDSLLAKRGCEKCRENINWKKILTKTLLKIFVSGLIKALITHIILTHMKK